MKANRSTSAWYVVASMVLAASVAQAEDHPSLAEVEKQLIARWSAVHSVSARMTVDSVVTLPNGSSTIKSEGTYELVKDGTQRFMRWEMCTKSRSLIDDKETLSESSNLTITDGAELQGLVERGDRKMAVKLNWDETLHLDPAALMDNLRAYADVKYAGEEKIDGQPVHLIEGRSHNPANPIARTVYAFARDTGLLLRKSAYSADERTYTIQELSEVKLNSDIPRERFVFVIPEGAQLSNFRR